MKNISIDRAGFSQKYRSYTTLGEPIFGVGLRNHQDAAFSSDFCLRLPATANDAITLIIRTPSNSDSIAGVDELRRPYDCNHLDIETCVPVSDDEALKIVAGEIFPIAYDAKNDVFVERSGLIADAATDEERGFALWKIATLRRQDASECYEGVNQEYFQAFWREREENSKKYQNKA